MDCITDSKQGAEILLDYSAGTLDPIRAAELASHIRDCPDCARLIDAQRAVWETLDEWKPVEVAPEFDARLYARIAAEEAAPGWRQWLRRMMRPAVPLTAAAAVLSLALFIRFSDWDDQLPDQAKTAPVAQVKTTAAEGAQGRPTGIDPDQLEQALEDMDLVSAGAM
jgi:anti-sigma-K factor RskA